MKVDGFTGSATKRLIFAGIYAAVAFKAVAMIIAHGAVPTSIEQLPASPPPALGMVVLTLQSTYPVAHWTVQVAGKDVLATTSDSQRWSGQLAVHQQAGEVFIQADATDPLASGACAVRAAVTGAHGDGRVTPVCPVQMLWGDGFIAATLAIPAATAQAIPHE
jgi:hypothetical protein